MKSEYFVNPGDTRALGSPKKEKAPRPENDVLKDGYDRSEQSNSNWLDNRREYGNGGGRSF